MILVTGAAGKTGQAVLRGLARKGAETKAFVRLAKQEAIARTAGAKEIVIGDLAERTASEQALTNVEAVYFICPNMHPDEFEIGNLWISAAKAAGVQRFVYHSVLFPQIEAMPHHWQKLRVEETLIGSGLDFTILQPASYMQNILPYWAEISQRGKYRVPYSVDTLFCPVDLQDVAAVAATAMTGSGHAGSIYQLAGPEILSTVDVAAQISNKLGRYVQAENLLLGKWRETAKGSDYALDALSKMFAYYDKHGLWSSSGMLENLLKRPPTLFASFLRQLEK